MTETGPFTELNSRRLGPVRRFFVRRPRVMDALVVALGAISVGTSDLDSGSSRPVAAEVEHSERVPSVPAFGAAFSVTVTVA